MPGVARIGDDDVPHPGPCTSPMKRIQGSGNTFVNGRALTYQGAVNNVHYYLFVAKRCITHVGGIQVGSTTVFVNGLGVGRQGDALFPPCTAIATGSTNVFAGG